MKLIDTIHDSLRDPRKASENASRSHTALIVYAIVAVALIFVLIWVSNILTAALQEQHGVALEIVNVALHIILTGGCAAVIILMILHAIPIFIDVWNQLRGIEPEPLPELEPATEPSPEPHSQKRQLIDLFTENVKDRKGLAEAVTQKIREARDSSDLVVIFNALLNIKAIKNNQTAFIDAYPFGDFPISNQAFSKIYHPVKSARKKSYENRTDKEDIYLENVDSMAQELEKYCKK